MQRWLSVLGLLLGALLAWQVGAQGVDGSPASARGEAVPVMHWYNWFPFGSVPEVSPHELQAALRDAPPQVVDVRTQREWESGHLPGAVHLSILSFSAANIAALGLDPDRPVVAVCASAHRSIPAVRKLRSLGYADAQQLQGGMNAWKREGLGGLETGDSQLE